MVGLFVDGWYPSEENAVMITPLFTMAGSLLTMSFPVLMLISGKYTSLVPWLILISNILLGVALLSTFSQRRVLVLHRGVHLSALLFVASIASGFVGNFSLWNFIVPMCWSLHHYIPCSKQNSGRLWSSISERMGCIDLPQTQS